VIALVGDVTEASVIEAVLDALGGPADVVLCDAAPKLTGVRAVDRAREEQLLTGVEAAIPRLLRAGGQLLLKILEGPEAQAVERRIRSRFQQAKAVRPGASRKGTSERYVLGRGYRGSE
jgi:23S rRNA (uridine2552-2'-O)-methyltransferase